jgi:peroxiredoxin
MLAVTALVALVVVALIEQNRQLKDTLAGLAQQQGSSGSSRTSAYEAGMQIPDVELRSLDGSEQRSAAILSSKVGVLAIMTTTCQFCQLTLPQWGNIAEELNQRGAAFAAVSLDSLDDTRAYVERNNIDFDVAVLDAAEYGRLGVTSVPLTLAFSEGGEVLGSWSGALDAIRANEVIARIESALEGSKK